MTIPLLAVVSAVILVGVIMFWIGEAIVIVTEDRNGRDE